MTAVDFLPQLDLRGHQVVVAVAPLVIAAHTLRAAQFGVEVPRRASDGEFCVEVVSQHHPFPEFDIGIDLHVDFAECFARVAEKAGEDAGLDLGEKPFGGGREHVARIVLREDADVGVEGVFPLARPLDVVGERGRQVGIEITRSEGVVQLPVVPGKFPVMFAHCLQLAA